MDVECKHMGWHFKQWLDRYKINVEYKGGQKQINPELVICTSQYLPEQIWSTEDAKAIRRRCQMISWNEDEQTTLAYINDVQQSLVRTVLPDQAAGEFLGTRVRWEKVYS